MSESETPVIDITEEALATILELREGEAIDDLHLALRISGVGANGYVYETAFLRPEDVMPADHVERHDGLPVAIAEGSVDDLRGAVLVFPKDASQRTVWAKDHIKVGFRDIHLCHHIFLCAMIRS